MQSGVGNTKADGVKEKDRGKKDRKKEQGPDTLCLCVPNSVLCVWCLLLSVPLISHSERVSVCVVLWERGVVILGGDSIQALQLVCLRVCLCGVCVPCTNGVLTLSAPHTMQEYPSSKLSRYVRCLKSRMEVCLSCPGVVPVSVCGWMCECRCAPPPL